MNHSMFFPSWVFDAVLGKSFRDGEYFKNRSEDLNLLPILESTQLGIAASLLCTAQQSLLSNPFKSEIELDPVNSFKILGQDNRTFRKKWLNSFGNLGISTVQQWDGSISRLYPIFDSHYWKIHETCQTLNLKLGHETFELLTGFVCGFNEIKRKLNGQPLVRSIISNRVPLVFEKSLWLDMKGVENTIGLLIKTISQWEIDQIQEKVFNLDFDLIHYTLSQVLLGNMDIKRTHRILKRVLKKMLEHGVLSPVDEDRFFAFMITQKANLKLVFQNSSYSCIEKKIDGFRNLVTKGYLKRVFSSKHRLTELFGLEPGFDIPKKAFKRFENQKGFLDCIFLDETTYIPIALLPFYYLGRMKTKLPDQFSQKIIEMSGGELNYGNIWSRFESLIAVYSEKVPVLKQELQLVDGLKIGDLDLNFASSIAKTRRDVKGFTPGIENKQEVKFERPEAKENSSNHVGQYLERLKNDGDGASYLELQQKYLSTLTQSEMKLFVAIRQRLSKDIFDRHLEPRLKKFLLENKNYMKEISPAAL